MVPCESTSEKHSFEWSPYRISYTEKFGFRFRVNVIDTVRNRLMVTDFSGEILKLSLVPFVVCQLPAWFNIAIVQETKSLKEYTYSCLISVFPFLMSKA